MSNIRFLTPIISLVGLESGQKRLPRLGAASLAVFSGLIVLFWLMGAAESLAQPTATTLFVTEAGGGDCSQASPCDLHTAVSLADPGDEIHVATGTYTNTGGAVITLTVSISLTGGYDAGDWDAAPDPLVNPTVLDGQSSRRVVGITGDISPLIQNFIIANGRSIQGAGIYNESGTPTIQHNIIRNNQTDYDPHLGGGIYDAGAAVIAANEIRHNGVSGGFGGGIYVQNNNAADTIIRLNDIHDNAAGSTGLGGGVYVRDGRALIEANTFYNNTASWGGGLYAFSFPTSLKLYSNLFHHNEAQANSGGAVALLADAVLWNNTIANNQANDEGGGIYASGAAVTISNTIVAFNDAGTANDGIFNENGTITGGYNNVYSDTVSGGIAFTDDISGDPDFVERQVPPFNYHLNAGSPNIDAGDPNTPVEVNIDFDGQARPFPPAWDVGADEYGDLLEVTIEPVTSLEAVDRDTTATFTHTVRNTGNLPDSYDFVCDHSLGWTVTCPLSVTLNPQQAVPVNTLLAVPAAATALEQSQTTIQVISNLSTTISSTAVVRTIVNPLPGLEFTPTYSTTVLPGDVITFTHTLTNTGDAPDNITLQLLPGSSWAELLPAETYLASGQSALVRVRVTVPPRAPEGLADIAQIEAVSEHDTAVSAIVTDTVVAKPTVGTRYVATNGSDSDNNCTQLSTPCLTVQHAVGQASFDDKVYIAAGTYHESGIPVNDTIHISGGWTNGYVDQGKPDQSIIDAAGATLIFNIAPGSAVQPSISNLTLRNGDNAGPGGAVYVGRNAQPLLEKIIFENNKATLGGAVYVSSSALARIQQSAFYTNTASVAGGAVYVTSGIARIQNDLFKANSATGHGGAVYLAGGIVTLGNNTFVENLASGNGGGVYNNGAANTVVNSIFDHNNAANGEAIYHQAGSTTLNYSDLWQNDTVNVPAGTGNINADPLFIDDQYRLGRGSPALDVADPNTTLLVDFEDDFRPADAGFDMGYDELAGCRAQREGIPVPFGSIEEAIAAEAGSSLVRVTGICRGVSPVEAGGQTISQTVYLTQTFTIQGGWNNDFTERTGMPTYVDPEGRGRGFYISGDIAPVIEDLFIINGDATGLGGGPGNEDAGGGIYNLDSSPVFTDVRILTSTAVLGGGFYNHTGAPGFYSTPIMDVPDEAKRLEAPFSHIGGNTAVSGGGLYNYTGTLQLDGGRIYSNTAVSGGGLYNDQGAVTVTNAILYTNDASGNGGGIYNNVTADYLHLTFYGNSAALNGGGFYNAAGDPTIRNSIFQSNQGSAGPAIYVVSGSPNIDYNYYHDHPGGPLFGASLGDHDIDSAIPPGLTDPSSGNFHLLDTAAAVDTADPDSTILSDMDGEPRPSNQAPDMGADELVGCLVRLNDQIYGSIQAALAVAQPGDTLDVAGVCSGVHPYNAGTPSACTDSSGDMLTTVHLDKNVNLVGGWRLDFEGQGYTTTLDAEQMGRVIYVAPTVTATVEGFHIINGLADNGAGICIDNATPTIKKNEIYSHTATNGGAIYSLDSSALLDGNRVYLNQATSGGAFYSDAGPGVPATIQNNFIYSNTAVSGGAFYNHLGDNNFWHNTVYANNASGNGGAVYVANDSPAIRSNIVVSNTSGGVAGAYGAAGSTPSLGYNDFYGQVTDFGGTISGGGPGHLSVDPQFYDLPGLDFTLLYTTSPVIDLGDPALSVATDFADDIRPSHQGFDMGADEVGGCFARILSDPETIFGSVQAAVDAAAPGDTVQVDGICYGVNDRTSGGTVTQNLFVDKNLIIDGQWNYQDNISATLDALGQGRVLFVASGAVVTVTELILQNGDAAVAGLMDGAGGAVWNDGTLILQHGEVTNSTAVSGGGIYNNGVFTMTQTLVAGNNAANGGGLYQANGDLVVDGNRFMTNQADLGGAVYLSAGGTTVDVWNNFIYQNQAAVHGAGVYNLNNNGRIWHNTILLNIGDGLYSDSTSNDIRSNIFDRNSGAGIHTTVASLAVNFNNVYGNGSDYAGAAAAGVNDISQPPLYRSPAGQDYHLQENSPGVDQADPNLPAAGIDHDFDGHLRPTNGGPDMGADEINTCLIRVNDRIFGVFQDAIDYAEGFFPDPLPTVAVARGSCSGVLSRNGTLQVGYISQNLNIVGSLRRSNFSDPNDYHNPDVHALSSVIDAQGQGRVIVVANDAVPSIAQLAFVHGNAYAANDSNDNGGGIYNAANGQLTASTTETCANRAENGGGYYGGGGTFAYYTGAGTGGCSVAQFNDRDEHIGYAYYGGNTAVNGSGFYVSGGAVTNITNHGMDNNTAANHGGVIYNDGIMEVVNGLFWYNVAGGDGGAVHNTGSLSMLHNTLRDNEASGLGGGVYNDTGGSLTLNSSIIYTNTASSGGGGVHSIPSVTARYSNFYQNAPADFAGVTLGTGSRVGDPGLYFFSLNRHSRNIDAADPSLIDPPHEIDFDAQLVDRPDGGTIHNGIMRSDVGAFEYWKDFGCEVVPNTQESTVLPGDTITYTVDVYNAGSPSFLQDPFHSHGFTDTITITVASQVQGWGVLAGGDSQRVTLDYYDSASRVLTVTVPSDAVLGQQEIVSIQCQSGAIPGRQFTGQIQTDVGPVNSILVEPEYFGGAYPGDVLTYTHWITNASNSAGTFLLIPSAGAAGLSTAAVTRIEEADGNVITSTTGSIEQPVELAVNQVVTASLRVDILETAAIGEIANPGLIARSTEDPTIQGQVINQILISPTMGTRYVAIGGIDGGNNCLVADQPCATIQRAVDQALAGDAIRVAAGQYTDFITRTVGSDELEQNLFINKSVTIQGGYSILDEFATASPITNAVTLDGQDVRRGIYVAQGVTVTLSGLRVENGQSQALSGLNGSTRSYGGGIYNAGANLTVNGVWLLSNMGGGLYHLAGDLAVHNAVLAYNQSILNGGGGLYVADGAALLENNTFVANVAVPDGSSLAYGGGIYLANGEATVLNQIFQDNIANTAGEAIFVAATAVITNDYNLYFNQPNPIGGGSLGANSIPDADPDFVDSYFHIGVNSAAKDVGTTAVSIAGGLDFDLEPRLQGAGIDMGADERFQRPSFIFEPITQTVTIDSGTVHTHSHVLTNTGDFTDTYSLAMNNQVVPVGGTGWDYALAPTDIIDLARGDAVTVTLVITGGQPGYYDTTVITATSVSGPVHSVVDTTHITQTAGVDIDPSRSGSGDPGTPVVYTHTLTNTGNGPDIFTIQPITTTAVPQSWVVTVMPTQTNFLLPGEQTQFTTTVSIPAEALGDDQHWVEIEAIAASDTAVTDTLAVTTTVNTLYNLTLTPDNSSTVPDDTAVVYTHTLTNLGNVADTITLTGTSSPDWDLAFMPQNVTLPPFAATTAVVTVTVPAGVGGQTHLATITAESSSTMTATAVNTTTVAQLPGVLIVPDYDRAVDAGTTVVYAHTVTNTGNVADSFAISAASSPGWLDSFTGGPLALAPGASAAVYVTVTVPLGETPGMMDTTAITVTSGVDTAVTDSAVDITRVRQQHGLAFSPDHVDSAYEDSQISYSHTLTNTGNGMDTFAITTDSSQGWPVDVTPLSLSLNPGQAAAVAVTLTVPAATGGSIDVMQVTATSVISSAFSATVVNTTTSIISATRSVVLEPDNYLTGIPGVTISYTHYLTNTGAVADSYSLAVASSQGWTVAVDPANVALAAGAAAPVTVTVTIPGTAVNGQLDTTTVTAVSDTDPAATDQAQDVTVVQLPANGVLLEPDRQGEGVPGAVIIYNHVLTNTGQSTMAFLLTAQSSQGWPVAVEPARTDNILAGGSLAVTVVLTVPVTAVNGDEDFTTVTAVGLSDSSITDLALDRTQVAIRYGVLVAPDNTGEGIPGQIVTYTHTVQNTGNFTETFALSAVSNQGWVTAVSPTTLTLDPAQSSNLQVSVTIPAGANTNDVDVTTVTAVSTTPGSTAAGSATDTTTVIAVETDYLVYLPVVHKAQTCTTTGIDLIVTSIVVDPSPPVSGQPATVYVTIRNQGTANMVLGNNFFLDFYVDRVPAPLLVGDLHWGVQAILLPAGASVTYSDAFTFSGGSHQLWAQVDTDNTVDECPNEHNNLFGPMMMNATGSAAGNEGASSATDNMPRPTPTPPAAIVPSSTEE